MEKLGRLGSGASGTVFKARHVPSNTLVALKQLNAHDSDTRRQILNEMRTLCDNPNAPGLVKFYGAYYVADSSQMSIALEYMDGGSLEDFAKVLPGNRIPEAPLSIIVGRVLGGLDYLHRVRYMIHRDIKPANVLMNLRGEVKITDFGISTALGSTQGLAGTYVGTMYYMSPERQENHPYSYDADIWSLGLTVLHLATGRYPYDLDGGMAGLAFQVVGDPAPTTRPEDGCTAALTDFVARCLQKDPSKRPSAGELLKHPFVAAAATAAAAAAATAATKNGGAGEASAYDVQAEALAGFVRGLVPNADQRIAEDKRLCGLGT